jgi:benzoylformate decarboxylase
LWTAARYHIPVTFVVANNAQYKILKTSAGVMGLTHVPQAGYQGMNLDNPAVDIEGMARSLGVEALCVTEPEALTEAVAGSFSRSEPLLLEVPIER